MKVYVSELPKSCRDCPFYKLDTYVDIAGYTTNSYECVLDGSMLTNSCPLQSISDYTKQVRKEVCEELCDMLTDRAELIRTGDIAEFMFTVYDLKESINQIQGETNAKD